MEMCRRGQFLHFLEDQVKTSMRKGVGFCRNCDLDLFRWLRIGVPKILLLMSKVAIYYLVASCNVELVDKKVV